MMLQENDRGKKVETLQQKLKEEHFYKGAIDGVFGPNTKTAVAQFQEYEGLNSDGIAGSKTLGALGLNDPKYLFIHCSATPENSPSWDADKIVKGHLEDRGWSRPGYSRIIEYDGTIKETWALNLADGFQAEEITNGAKGFNQVSVHVCYVGGTDQNLKTKDTRTCAQKDSILQIVKEIINEVPDIKILGHKQVARKGCPSFSVPKWLRKNGIAEKNIYAYDKFGTAKTLEG